MTGRALALVAALLWTAVLLSAAAVVNAKHQARTLFVELEQLSADRDRLNIEWGRLQLEQSSWSAHGFVEQVANEKLHLTMPQANEVKIVQP
jgi:cell division protein FtsL